MVDEILDHAGRLDGAQALLVEHDGHLERQGAKGLVRVLPPPQPYHCPKHCHQGPSLARWHEASPGRVSSQSEWVGLEQNTWVSIHSCCGGFGNPALSGLPCRVELVAHCTISLLTLYPWNGPPWVVYYSPLRTSL